MYGNKYKLIDIINILELIFIINMLINIYYSNTTRTQLIPTNTNQCTTIMSHIYNIIIQYIEHISSQHIKPYQLISATHIILLQYIFDYTVYI